MDTNICLRTLRGPAVLGPSLLSPRPFVHVARTRQFSTRSPSPARDASASVEDRLNPLRSTLPPALDLPVRQPGDGTFSHLFKVGKVYLGFYKQGFKNIFANRRLLNSKVALLSPDDRPSLFKPHHVPATFSRADWILLWRTRHDLMRLPLFGLTFLLFEELTPLVAYFVEGIMPLTCRLPQHTAKSRDKAVARRKYALEEIKWKNPDGVSTASVAQSHILRSLNLVSNFWDRIGLIPPGLWQLKGRTHMGFLEADDRLLRKAGTLEQLSEDELLLACVDRGIDVNVTTELASGQNFHDDRRRLLRNWLQLTDGKDELERRKRMAILLTLKPEDWPETPGFPLPPWEI
ncbi:hypothetical protein VUR80DRAFT_2903 [Thermomyces stellatus]